MALITCPHCGKNVSDSVDTCIHCGKELKEKTAPQKEREYAALPFEEQRNLRKEFNEKYPDLSKYEKHKNDGPILLIIAICLLFVGVIMGVVGIKQDNFALAMVGVVIELLGFVGMIIGIVWRNKVNKKKLTELKRFQKWLKREKNVNYTVILDERNRKIFNQITID